MIDLSDAHEKLRWAKHHFEVLRPQIEAFEQRDAHTISCHVNPDTGEYTFYVHNLELVDPDWGLSISDCVHNARTALDYVLVRLWALVTGIDPVDVADIQFPIHSAKIRNDSTSTDIEKATAAARDSFKAFVAKCSKEPLFSGYLATIEQLQPFNNGNPSIWGSDRGLFRFAALPTALDRLSRLDNIDKHRVPHAAWASVNLVDDPTIYSLAPDEFQHISSSITIDALENNAQIASCVFATPLPSDWRPTEMEMKRCYPLQVAFSDPQPFKGVLEVLRLCLWGVEAVLTIFEPVFRPSHDPPLPVTAIAEPGA